MPSFLGEFVDDLKVALTSVLTAKSSESNHRKSEIPRRTYRHG